MDVRRVVALAVAALIGATGLAGLPTSAASSAPRHVPTTLPERVAAPEPVTIKVMSQNIMYGGDDFDLETGEYCAIVDGCDQALHRLARIIRAVGADVVGLQEPEHNVARLGRMLGWYASPAAHIISRFPIIQPPRGRGIFVFVEVAPDRVVAVSNVHLSSDPWGPDEVVAGTPLDEIMAMERAFRVRDIKPNLERLPALVDRGFPVILTGDFNSPSHLDWTAEMVDARPNVVLYPVRWPTSWRLQQAGFSDSYREIHPDPVENPAFTWTPGGPEGTAGWIKDRIDWVLHGGPASTVDSQIIGEQNAPPRADVDIAFPAPYPTDHRGVLSTLEVTPRTPPVYASTPPRPITSGETIAVSYHTPAARNDEILLARKSGLGTFRPVRRIPSPGDSAIDTPVAIGPNLDGVYHLIVRAQDGEVVSDQRVFVYQPDEKPAVKTTAKTFGFKQPIGVRFKKAPGNRLDWVGIIPCKRDGACGDGSTQIRYQYTDSRVQGVTSISGVFPPMVYREGWPIPPGEYVIGLFADDSYVELARSPRFTVVRR